MVDQKKKENLVSIVFVISIFIAMFIWFDVIHPLIIYHTDDWSYISCSRPGYPYWGAWNPTRIFPETFMPFCASIAAYIIYPITNDYIGSMTIVFACVVSLFITIYIYLFQRFISQKFELETKESIVFTCLFWVLHFVIFRSDITNNDYMFGSRDVTCYFYYILPCLLNVSIVLYLECRENMIYIWESRKSVEKGIFCFCIYMAIFSNLYSSIVLAVYSGIKLVYSFLGKTKNKSRTEMLNICKDNALWLIVLLTWGVSLIFESNGGRSGSFSSNSFWSLLIETLKNILELCRRFNKWFLLFSIGSILGTVFLIFKIRIVETRAIIKILRWTLPSMFLTLLYLILLSSKVNSAYIMRTDILLCVVFFGFVVLISGCVFIYKQIPQIMLLIPVLIFIMCFAANTESTTFKETNSENLDPQVCIAVDNYIIQEMKNADKEGLTEIILDVPKSDSVGNFPFALSASECISRTLYKHGIISYPIKVTFNPNEKINEIFYLDRLLHE